MNAKQLKLAAQLLFGSHPLTLSERLRLVNVFGGRASMGELLRERIQSDPIGGSYIPFGKRKIAIPEPTGDREDDILMYRGVSQVIRESFIHPDFISPVCPLHAGETAVDLGGNLGTTACLFSEAVGPSGRVIAVEPVFGAVLQRNIDLNGLTNTVLADCAVSDAPGTMQMEMTPFLLDSRFVEPGRETKHPLKEVPVKTLDQLAEEHGLERLDFVKMDIEGAEESALGGAVGVIERFKPRWSISSYHCPGGVLQHPTLVRILKGHGYTVHEVGTHHIYAVA